MTPPPALTSLLLEAAIQDMAAEGQRWRDASRTYEEWQRGKSAAKSAALQRIMRTTNPLNPQKPHSTSTAEAIIESDPAFSQVLADGIRLHLAKLEAEQAYLIAQYRCLYHATAGSLTRSTGTLEN
jgi:hypothetical protein